MLFKSCKHLQIPLLLFVLLSNLPGQRTTATISGTVTDVTGAVVPGARITVTESATGAVVTAEANSDGFYVLTSLSPGTYRLKIERDGFQTYVQENVVVQVGRPVSVNATLQIGTASQTVTVAGETEQVNLRSQTLSYEVTTQMVTQLPLNGRNILQLMTLAPDAGPTASSGYQQGASRPENANSYVGASGGRGDSTSFYLDGGLNEDALTEIANIFPNPDAIQEFSFQTNNYSAKFGGRGGGVMNAVTRGGTNAFHGAAFEFLRNSNLNARNFFAPSQDGLKRNQYGATIGGPIRKDKTFFFFSYQGTKLRVAPTNNVATTATAAQRAGDFSASRAAIVDPVTRVPFPDKQVPVSMFDPIALKILNMVPVGAPGTGVVFYPSRQEQNDNQYVARVDHNIGTKLRLYGSYLFDGLSQPSTSIANNLLTAVPDQYWRSQNVALNATYVFQPTLLVNFVGSLSRRMNRYTGPPGFPGWVELGVNVPKMTTQGSATSLRLGITNYFSASWNGFYTIPATVGNFGSHWTWIKSNHTFEFGVEIEKSKVVKNQDFLSDGNDTFNAALSGDNLLDFMLGKPSTFTQQQPFYITPERTLPALYAIDTWKVSRRLTLSLGVRWNPFVPVEETTYHQAGLFSMDAYRQGVRSQLYPNLPPGLLVQGDPNVPGKVIPSNYHIFNPRLGFAFDPFGDGKMSIRGGFGIYQDQMTGNTINPNYNPFTITTTIPFPASTQNPYLGQVNPFPINRPNPSSLTFPLPMAANPFTYGMAAPTIQQWNFTVERQFPWASLLRVAYEGQESYHLFGAVEGNAAVYDPSLSAADNRRLVNQRRPLGQYYQGLALGQNVGTSSFNALVISVEKRMTQGLTILAGYRWSKCLNESERAFFDANAYSSPNPFFDRGPCSYNVPHQFRLSYAWRIPSFKNLGFVGKHVIGNWETNGILNVRDGLPFTVSSGIDNSLSGIGMDRADIIGDPLLPDDRAKADKLQRWFNTQAFVTNALGTFGTSSRNLLMGPGLATVDFSVVKVFPLHGGPFREGQALHFRSEFFNLLNRANFNAPNSTVTASTFGRILSAGDPRIIQFGLKFVY